MTNIARACWLCACFWLSAPVSATLPEVIQWGWQPPVEFAGDGDAAAAVDQLRNYISLQRLVMEHTDYHPETQAFVDDLWGSLESFDLNGFYRLLPEDKAPWRQLTVYGEVGDERYHIGPAPLLRGDREGPVLGDFQAAIRAREIDGEDATHYLLNGNIGVGLGDVSWPGMVQATQDALRMVSGYQSPTPEYPSQDMERYRNLVAAMNPGLSSTETAVLAPLWAAYPDMWGLMAGLGEIDDLLVTDGPEIGYQHVEAVFTIQPQKLVTAYPDLAHYLDNLDSLVKAELDLYDEYGRLLRFNIDSETLQGKMSMVVRDGQVVPLRYERPVEEAPLFNPGERRHLRARLDSRMDILGIIAEVEGMTFEIDYEPTAEGARFVSRGRSVPRIDVGGRALGMVPTPVIDMFLPRRIDQLMEDFLTVACEGNGGEGITAIVEIGRDEDAASAQLRLQGAFEGLDNFFVQIGMAIINNRIIPDADESEDLQRLVYDAHQAFSNDLDQFEALSLTSTL